MSLLDTFKDWLPYPVYDFRGGPGDPVRRAVTLIETSRGMGPPPYWRVAPRPPIDFSLPIEPMQNEQVVPVWTYQFVPLGRWNEGYYRYLEEK